MILVTVGTSCAFDRLVRAADELAASHDEPMIIQRGLSSHVPQFARHAVSVDEPQMLSWLSQARVVVAHAGAGTILCTLAAGKPMVLAPRVSDLGEAIDDHQFELARALSEQGRAVMVTELSAETLAEAIVHAPRQTEGEHPAACLQTELRSWLAEQAAQPPSRLWRTFRGRTKEGT